MSEARVYSYKLEDDTGFAPNPFWGALTLATCKPGIRRTKKPGDWIAGFTSNALNCDGVGNERLVFLMQVDTKLPIARYFSDHHFKEKIPTEAIDHVRRVGDNIYFPLNPNAIRPEEFKRVENIFHTEDKKPDDISGEYVLVSREAFAYFGVSAITIPAQLRPRIPPRQAPYGWLTQGERAREFIEFVRNKSGLTRRIVNHPHSWPSGDESWKHQLEL